MFWFRNLVLFHLYSSTNSLSEYSTFQSHRAQSNLTHHLRHGRCTMDASAVSLHRRTSPPDFEKIHAKVSLKISYLKKS